MTGALMWIKTHLKMATHNIIQSSSIVDSTPSFAAISSMTHRNPH